ncbi:hypothetical protein M2164_008493 [Streptomyces sp. SAI-208]|nr:hypothetical protein [Streptomyces sp. SAI-208]
MRPLWSAAKTGPLAVTGPVAGSRGGRSSGVAGGGVEGVDGAVGVAGVHRAAGRGGPGGQGGVDRGGPGGGDGSRVVNAHAPAATADTRTVHSAETAAGRHRILANRDGSVDAAVLGPKPGAARAPGHSFPPRKPPSPRRPDRPPTPSGRKPPPDEWKGSRPSAPAALTAVVPLLATRTVLRQPGTESQVSAAEVVHGQEDRALAVGKPCRRSPSDPNGSKSPRTPGLHGLIGRVALPLSKDCLTTGSRWPESPSMLRRGRRWSRFE